MAKSKKSEGHQILQRVNIICAGVPCQDVSVAGKRAGLTGGTRTKLFYHFARLLRELRPAWFVFENVPGLFSSHQGRDFAEVLRVLMVECGYGVCWRVLDSRYFGVAQRRRRVFIVGCFGKPCPPEILFEPACRRWNPSPGGETRADIAGPITESFAKHGGASGGKDSHLHNAIVSNSITTRWGKGVGGRAGQETQNIVQQAISSKWAKGSSGPAVDEHHNLIVAASLRESDGHHGRSSPRGDGQDNLVATLNSGGNDGGFRTEPGEHIVFDTTQITSPGNYSNPRPGDPCHPLASGAHAPAVAFALPSEHRGVGQGHNTNYVSSETDANRVRDFARLPKGLDSARYRALGNAVTVQVAEWIAKRIVAYEKKETLKRCADRA